MSPNNKRAISLKYPKFNYLEENPYQEEWEEYASGGKGSFMKYIALAFQQADSKNVLKLQSAFPEVSKIFALWKTAGKKDHFEG